MTSTNKASTEIAPKKASLTLRAQISDMQGELASDSALRIALSHGLQVSDLALVLYDSLAPLHGLSDTLSPTRLVLLKARGKTLQKEYEMVKKSKQTEQEIEDFIKGTS